MPKKSKPYDEGKPEDYREAAEDSLELAKVLVGQGGSDSLAARNSAHEPH
jgi:hypothetical protein